MNCPAVRDLLPEHALSLLAPRDRTEIQRHLAWCAACRKEAAGLEEAGAVFGLTAASAEPPGDLQERVVDAVSARAAKESTIRHRVRFLGVAASVAAVLLALSGLGWGAVMAARVGDAERRAGIAEQQREQGEGVRALLAEQLVKAPRDRLLFAWLVPNDGGPSSGWGYVIASPGQPDLVGAKLVGLPADIEMPVRVWLTGGGDRILVTRAHRVDTSGGLEQARRIDDDLSGATVMVVKDAAGRVLLSGFLDASG